MRSNARSGVVQLRHASTKLRSVSSLPLSVSRPGGFHPSVGVASATTTLTPINGWMAVLELLLFSERGTRAVGPANVRPTILRLFTCSRRKEKAKARHHRSPPAAIVALVTERAVCTQHAASYPVLIPPPPRGNNEQRVRSHRRLPRGGEGSLRPPRIRRRRARAAASQARRASPFRQRPQPPRCVRQGWSLRRSQEGE